jgi:hypothetical protein
VSGQLITGHFLNSMPMRANDLAMAGHNKKPNGGLSVHQLFAEVAHPKQPGTYCLTQNVFALC